MVAKKVSTALVTLSALLINVAPAAAMSIQVTGNGADSSTTANVSVTQTVSILQTNNADIDNDVTAKANSGYNEANDNTGGDVSIETGDATTKVSTATSANSNTQKLGCCPTLDAVVKVSGNGADSRNNVNLSLTNEYSVEESNNLDIDNDIFVFSNTGGNEANGNTGGDVRIKTGDANALVVIDNKGNENVIVIGALNDPAPKPNPTPGVNPLPTTPSVLGATKLPMTGFDLPVKMILAASAGLIGLGVVLNKKASSLKTTFKVA
jgi:hypothetical protein